MNCEIVLGIDTFPTRSQNRVMADRSNKPKPSVCNPKKTSQELEEEDDEMYAPINEMEWRQVTDPDVRREYDALGEYLWTGQVPTCTQAFSAEIMLQELAWAS
uniref:Uncharacterized protein n=1 Tax=Romanomermis culicivorax TaxID=13658 RepID=A0A915JE95_ROMCU